MCFLVLLGKNQMAKSFYLKQNFKVIMKKCF